MLGDATASKNTVHPVWVLFVPQLSITQSGCSDPRIPDTHCSCRPTITGSPPAQVEAQVHVLWIQAISLGVGLHSIGWNIQSVVKWKKPNRILQDSNALLHAMHCELQSKMNVRKAISAENLLWEFFVGRVYRAQSTRYRRVKRSISVVDHANYREESTYTVEWVQICGSGRSQGRVSAKICWGNQKTICQYAPLIQLHQKDAKMLSSGLWMKNALGIVDETFCLDRQLAYYFFRNN